MNKINDNAHCEATTLSVFATQRKIKIRHRYTAKVKEFWIWNKVRHDICWLVGHASA